MKLGGGCWSGCLKKSEELAEIFEEVEVLKKEHDLSHGNRELDILIIKDS